MQQRRRFALVYNARAGLALPRLLDGVLTRLRTAGAEIFVLPARSAAEAAERVAEAAAADACDAVIAAGGDGTFRAVATGAAGTSLPVGVIPLGTGNVIARELGIRRTPEGVAGVLLHGGLTAAHGGLVNGAPFFLMTGAGFDGRIIAGLDYGAKRALGRAAYLRPCLRALAAGPQMFDVTVDGAPMRASWVIVARASRYGGSFVLTRQTGVGASEMIAVVIAAETRAQLAEASLALARGRLADPEKTPAFVRIFRANAVDIGHRVEAPVEIDGDAGGVTPVSIRRGGPTVQVIAPPGYAPLDVAHAQVADLTNRHTNRVS